MDEYCSTCATSVIQEVVCNVYGMVCVDEDNDGEVIYEEGLTANSPCGAKCTVEDLEDIYQDGILKRAKYMESGILASNTWGSAKDCIYWTDGENSHASKSVDVSVFGTVRS